MSAHTHVNIQYNTYLAKQPLTYRISGVERETERERESNGGIEMAHSVVSRTEREIECV